MRVELTEFGSVRLDADTARAVGAAETTLVHADVEAVELTMLPKGAVGGLILKRTTRDGARAVLVVEHIREHAWQPGTRHAAWDAARRTLRIPLRAAIPEPAT